MLALHFFLKAILYHPNLIILGFFILKSKPRDPGDNLVIAETKERLFFSSGLLLLTR